jgi:RNA polymerase sigma-70 factor (ECF subfamily)
VVAPQSNFETIDHTRVGIWFQQYSNRGVQYANSLVRSLADAEEIVQDAFCRLLKCIAAKPIESENRFRATFFTTIRNLCIDLLRQRKRRKNVSLESVNEPATRQFSPQQYELASHVIQCLIDQLPQQWAEALRLKVYGSLSYDEIAATLDCTKAQVRTWIFRARKQLKEEIEKHGLRYED